MGNPIALGSMARRPFLRAMDPKANSSRGCWGQNRYKLFQRNSLLFNASSEGFFELPNGDGVAFPSDRIAKFNR